MSDEQARYDHWIEARQLRRYIKGWHLVSMLDKHFGTQDAPWNQCWSFDHEESTELGAYTRIRFREREQALGFAKALNDTFGIVMDAPFTVHSPAPEDAVWTQKDAEDLILHVEGQLRGLGFARPEVIGGVAKLGYSLNDLDLLLKCGRSPMTMEDAILAIERRFLPEHSSDKTFTPNECPDHENVWFLNIQLLPDQLGRERVIEFYLSEVDFPWAETQLDSAQPRPRSSG